MKTNKIIYGGLAGGIVFFLLGWLIYGILLMDYSAANYDQSIMRAEDDFIWWAMIVSNLAYGFMMALFLSWTNTKGMMPAAKLAAFIGFLFAFSFDFGMYSMTTMFSNLGSVFVDIIVFTVIFTIMGVVVDWAMGLAKSDG